MQDGMLNLTESEILRAISALSTAKSYLQTDDYRHEVFQLILDGLNTVKSSVSEQFDGTYFLEIHASSFADHVKSINSTTEFTDEKTFWLAFFTYVIVKERSFKNGTFSEIDLRLANYFDSNNSRFNAEQKMRIDFLRLNLPRHLLTQTAKNLKQDHVNAVQKNIEKLEEINAKIQTWDSKITYWNARAEALENNLKESAEKLNFVGLAKAFSNLIEEKNAEKRVQVIWMFILGITLLLLPTLSKLVTSHFNIELKLELASLSYVMPFLIAELVSLYFFRIFLHNFYSIKTQLLQLKLRHSLCAFIEGYSEFVERSKKSSDDRLFEKFESMIFSGISPDPLNVPNHFDGFEQISKLIKDVRS